MQLSDTTPGRVARAGTSTPGTLELVREAPPNGAAHSTLTNLANKYQNYAVPTWSRT
jgi:hypothetical protein